MPVNKFGRLAYRGYKHRHIQSPSNTILMAQEKLKLVAKLLHKDIALLNPLELKQVSIIMKNGDVYVTDQALAFSDNHITGWFHLADNPQAFKRSP